MTISTDTVRQKLTVILGRVGLLVDDLRIAEMFDYGWNPAAAVENVAAIELAARELAKACERAEGRP